MGRGIKDMASIIGEGLIIILSIWVVGVGRGG
jgi:hypothetical protein